MRASFSSAPICASAVVSFGFSGPVPRRSTSRPPSVAGEREVDGLAGRLQRLGQPPGDRDRARKRRRQDGTLIDRHDDVRTAAGETDGEDFPAAALGVQHGAAAAFAMGIDEIGDRRFDAG